MAARNLIRHSERGESRKTVLLASGVLSLTLVWVGLSYFQTQKWKRAPAATENLSVNFYDAFVTGIYKSSYQFGRLPAEVAHPSIDASRLNRFLNKLPLKRELRARIENEIVQNDNLSPLIPLLLKLESLAEFTPNSLGLSEVMNVISLYDETYLKRGLNPFIESDLNKKDLDNQSPIVLYLKEEIFKTYRAFALKAMRYRDLDRWLKTELYKENGGKLFRYLDYLQNKKRYAIQIVTQDFSDSQTPITGLLSDAPWTTLGPIIKMNNSTTPGSNEYGVRTAFERLNKLSTFGCNVPFERGVLQAPSAIDAKLAKSSLEKWNNESWCIMNLGSSLENEIKATQLRAKLLEEEKKFSHSHFSNKNPDHAGFLLKMEHLLEKLAQLETDGLPQYVQFYVKNRDSLQAITSIYENVKVRERTLIALSSLDRQSNAVEEWQHLVSPTATAKLWASGLATLSAPHTSKATTSLAPTIYEYLTGREVIVGKNGWEYSSLLEGASR